MGSTDRGRRRSGAGVVGGVVTVVIVVVVVVAAAVIEIFVFKKLFAKIFIRNLMYFLLML
jgi:hypothetical protein